MSEKVEVGKSRLDSVFYGAIGDQRATVHGREGGPDRAKLYQFTKDGRYVDVALKFDDGKQISCHRHVITIFGTGSGLIDCLNYASPIFPVLIGRQHQ